MTVTTDIELEPETKTDGGGMAPPRKPPAPPVTGEPEEDDE